MRCHWDEEKNRINETLRRTMNDEKPAASIAEVLQGIIAEKVQKHAVRK